VSRAEWRREGLEVLASNAIDAVILDYQMPEIDGELVAAEMKRTNPPIPILMLSGCVSLHKLKGSLKIGSLCFCSNCP
jgi:CheY-like chemotaxis protein